MFKVVDIWGFVVKSGFQSREEAEAYADNLNSFLRVGCEVKEED